MIGIPKLVRRHLYIKSRPPYLFHNGCLHSHQDTCTYTGWGHLRMWHRSCKDHLHIHRSLEVYIFLIPYISNQYCLAHDRPEQPMEVNSIVTLIHCATGSKWNKRKSSLIKFEHDGQFHWVKFNEFRWNCLNLKCVFLLLDKCYGDLLRWTIALGHYCWRGMYIKFQFACQCKSRSGANITVTLHERHDVWSHQQPYCLFNSVLMLTTKITSKLCITRCARNAHVTSDRWIPLRRKQWGNNFSVMMSSWIYLFHKWSPHSRLRKCRRKSWHCPYKSRRWHKGSSRTHPPLKYMKNRAL